MKGIYTKAASVLAFAIGAMAIYAGGKVLLGQLPDYYVISWLPIYNFSMGLISAFGTAILLWRGHRWGNLAAIATLGLHGAVMIVLQTAFADVVAPDSLRAMTLRIAAWSVIVFLVGLQWRQDRA